MTNPSREERERDARAAEAKKAAADDAKKTASATEAAKEADEADDTLSDADRAARAEARRMAAREHAAAMELLNPPVVPAPAASRKQKQSIEEQAKAGKFKILFNGVGPFSQGQVVSADEFKKLNADDVALQGLLRAQAIRPATADDEEEDDA
jgi:hypothetical protein